MSKVKRLRAELERANKELLDKNAELQERLKNCEKIALEISELKGINDALQIKLKAQPVVVEEEEKPKEAVNICKLHRISIPEDSALGGPSSLFRSLDPGIRIKLHLFKARCYWSYAINRLIWTSSRTLDRGFNYLSDTSNGPITRDDIKNAAKSLDFSSSDIHVDINKSSVAPEYDDILPSNGHTIMTVRPDGKSYEAVPIWINGRLQSDDIVPYALRKNTSEVFEDALDTLKLAFNHLHYAAYLFMLYTTPEYSILFLTPPEINALNTLLRLHDKRISERPHYNAEQRLIYAEVLRYLKKYTNYADVRKHYDHVIANMQSTHF